jgi:hypothetical protein
LSFLSESIALGWSCRAGPPTSAKPVSDSTVSTYASLGDGVEEEALDGDGEVEAAAKMGTTLAPRASSSMTMPA